MAIAEIYEDMTDALADDEINVDEAPEAPEDAEQVNRRLRRLAAIRVEQADLHEVWRAERDRLDGWHEHRANVLASKERWLLDGLELYHRALLAADPSRKTISLPCGTLKARAQQPEWSYEDEEAFLAWAEMNAPDLVRLPDPRPLPDKAAAKKVLTVPALEVGESAPAVTGDGEVVPGVIVTVRGPAFSIDTDGGA